MSIFREPGSARLAAVPFSDSRLGPCLRCNAHRVEVRPNKAQAGHSFAGHFVRNYSGSHWRTCDDYVQYAAVRLAMCGSSPTYD